MDAVVRNELKAREWYKYTPNPELFPTIVKPSSFPSEEELLAKVPQLPYSPQASAALRNQYPELFELLRLGGLNEPGTPPITIKNPYTGKLDDQNWSNCYEHDVQVARGVHVLMLELATAGVIDSSLVSKAVEIALLHDVNRRYEQMEQDARKLAEDSKNQLLDMHPQLARLKFQPLTKFELEQAGLDPRLVDYLFKFDQPTGGEYTYKYYRASESTVLSRVRVLTEEIEGASRRGEEIDEILSHPQNRKLLIDASIAMVDNLTYSSIPKLGEPTQHGFMSSYDRILACQNRGWFHMMWEHLYILEDGVIKYWRQPTTLPRNAVPLTDIISIQIAFSRDVAQLLALLLKLPEGPKEQRGQIAESQMLELLRQA